MSDTVTPLRRLLPALAAALLLASAPLRAAELHVDRASGSDSNDGSSWAQALRSIPRALEICVLDPDADRIHVAEGIYPEPVAVGLSGVTLLGGYPAGGGVRDPATHETIVQGGGIGPAMVVSGLGGTMLLEGVTIDGFTLVDGASWERAGAFFGGGGLFVEEAAVVITNNVIRDSTIRDGTKGGGLYLYRSAAGPSTIADNLISGNAAEDGLGGGVALVDLADDPLSAGAIVFERNRVLDNRAVALTDRDPGAADEPNGQGGGIWLWGGSPILRNNQIRGNAAEEANDQDFQGQGGGLFILDAEPVLTGNLIENNRAIGGSGSFTGSGGGLYVLSTPTDSRAGALIEDNRINGNSAEGAEGSYQAAGAGLLLTLFGESAPLLSNNRIEDNRAVGGGASSARGGGLYAYVGQGFPSSLRVSGGSVGGNKAASAGGGLWVTAFDAGDAVVESVSIEGNESDVASGMMAFGDLDLRHLTIRGNRLYDPDGDEVSEIRDNCPGLANPVQADADADGLGDDCDPDDDDDGVLDAADNCPLVSNPGQGADCTGDRDGDGVPDGADNCPSVANSDQVDTDIPSNGVGDACEPARFDPLETNASGLWLVGDARVSNLEITGNVGQGLQIVGFPESVPDMTPEDPSSPIITNLTIADNVAAGFITYLADGTLLENSIVALNSLSDGFDTERPNGDPSSPDITCNSVYFGDGIDSLPCTGTGNLDFGPAFDQPPRFVSGPLGDHYLEQTAAGGGNDSVAVDAGTRAVAGSAVEGRTTRVDEVADLGTVDLGYHYGEQVAVAVEDCGNGLDDDGDGGVDCSRGNEDLDCPCGPESQVEGNCGDGVDNDGDGLSDAADPDCRVPEDCANGLDDDGDGAVDCVLGNADADCPCGAESVADSNCSDGIDNDGDGQADLDDADCAGAEDCANGSDDDGDGDADCADLDCLASPPCASEDYDGDGVVNGADCLPANDQAWAVPAEVSDLRVTKEPGGVLLSWTGLAPQAGPSTVHDLVSGALSGLQASGSPADGTCLADGEPANSRLDTRPTAPDEATWYLVRGQCACGSGPYGADSLGLSRGRPIADCP